MHADMMQECLFHLWITEREKPNQTRSWYLQSCRFHLQHWLAAGRSVDHPRRPESESLETDAEHPALSDYHTDGELFEVICFQDTVSALEGRLSKRQLAVLSGLVNGQTVREIASTANLSYPTVLKYRNIIADLTTKLGIARAPLEPRPTEEGAKQLAPNSESNRLIGFGLRGQDSCGSA